MSGLDPNPAPFQQYQDKPQVTQKPSRPLYHGCSTTSVRRFSVCFLPQSTRETGAHQDALLEIVEAVQALVSLFLSSLALHVAAPELLDASVVFSLPLERRAAVSSKHGREGLCGKGREAHNPPSGQVSPILLIRFSRGRGA